MGTIVPICESFYVCVSEIMNLSNYLKKGKNTKQIKKILFLDSKL